MAFTLSISLTYDKVFGSHCSLLQTWVKEDFDFSSVHLPYFNEFLLELCTAASPIQSESFGTGEVWMLAWAWASAGLNGQTQQVHGLFGDYWECPGFFFFAFRLTKQIPSFLRAFVVACTKRDFCDNIHSQHFCFLLSELPRDLRLAPGFCL